MRPYTGCGLRKMSGRPAVSILMHSAPSKARMCAQKGPAACSVKSATRTPRNGGMAVVGFATCSDGPMLPPLIELRSLMTQPLAPDRLIIGAGLSHSPRERERFSVELKGGGERGHRSERGKIERRKYAARLRLLRLQYVGRLAVFFERHPQRLALLDDVIYTLGLRPRAQVLVDFCASPAALERIAQRRVERPFGIVH